MKDALCRKCGEELDAEINANLIYFAWLKLMNYVEHELLEGEITQDSFDDLTNSLMLIKPYLNTGASPD
jgi:hypothetical protein